MICWNAGSKIAIHIISLRFQVAMASRWREFAKEWQIIELQHVGLHTGEYLCQTKVCAVSFTMGQNHVAKTPRRKGNWSERWATDMTAGGRLLQNPLLRTQHWQGRNWHDESEWHRHPCGRIKLCRWYSFNITFRIKKKSNLRHNVIPDIQAGIHWFAKADPHHHQIFFLIRAWELTHYQILGLWIEQKGKMWSWIHLRLQIDILVHHCFDSRRGRQQ